MIAHIARLIIPAVVIISFQFHAVFGPPASIVGVAVLPVAVASDRSIIGHPPPTELILQIVPTCPETSREGVFVADDVAHDTILLHGTFNADQLRSGRFAVLLRVQPVGLHTVELQTFVVASNKAAWTSRELVKL